ncbi:glycoside hydrolase family 172 protein [Pelagicoccus mobilis]|uniref:DUF2961 domain-containing protein n=1 Tax=Pelagicoccus mobilis TaxID=415221 RepID=A0A934VQ34_9BACT|nr:glycoside hydrolase family 172 protein [Pelagicoccus mobilis]MBK1876109.1 DUF2961 domain-containing protein [Pelagicoccus mobilis]
MSELPFNGLNVDLGNLWRLSSARSRSISPENPDGSKSGGGRAFPDLEATGDDASPARELGQGWKARPYVKIEAGEVLEIASIEGPGAIQHIWMTPTGTNRCTILRVYWDGQDTPSIECPIGDFFASAYTVNWGDESRDPVFAQVTSSAVCVNPGNAFNCYWEMPFRESCRVTIENLDGESMNLFYQIDYVLTEVPEDAAYFHAQFRRTNPVPKGDVYTILDGVVGRGHYVGTYQAWQVNSNRWWGEGEIKFYLDGDADPEVSEGKVVGGSTGFPTICGTGAEDYYCGSYNFENRARKRYQEFCTPYAGMPYVERPDGLYQANTRFSLYRWHVKDPIRFEEDIKVTIQALGWTRDRRFKHLQDDISSVAFWYQCLPTVAFPPLPGRDDLEVD